MAVMDEQTRTRDVLDVPRGREAMERAMPDVVHLAETTGKALLDLPVDALTVLFKIKAGVQSDLWQRLAQIQSPDRVEAEAVLPDLHYEDNDATPASARMLPISAGKVNATLQVVFEGPSHGNPFTDVELHAVFEKDGQEVKVGGFYDGHGRYIVRFLPPTAGLWRFHTISTARSLNGMKGEVQVTASPERGPVRVEDTYHFAYSNGEVFRPAGTTLYAWTHQGKELQEETLSTLSSSPFTKVRMCVFPKDYAFNNIEPDLSPFERDGGEWDTTRFNPAFFQHLEKRIRDLRNLGIEADVILFHPYDRWGFSDLGKAADDRYLRYIVRRLAAVPNVWWSLANEYDFVTSKRREDWERFARIVIEEDHAGHLLSIHNGTRMFDYSANWATHCSIQKIDYYKTAELVEDFREKWRKPVVLDEIGYEGNLESEWGSLAPTEVVRRVWETTLRGGYYTHGETYHQEDGLLWWARGGHLVGQSMERIAFLENLISESPTGRLEPISSNLLCPTPVSGVKGRYEVHYNSYSQHKFRSLEVPEGCAAEIDIIDTWAMTIETLPGTYTGSQTIELPGRPYMALRMRVLEKA